MGKINISFEGCLYLKGVEGNNIENIKENELFGLIISDYCFSMIVPEFHFSKDGCYTFRMGITRFNNTEKICFDFNVPLIFRKLSGNLVQEMLTGEIFVIHDFKDEPDEKEELDKMKVFQGQIERYKNNNVILNDGWYTEVAAYNAYFVVDDGFKKLYCDETLARRDEVISALKELSEKGKQRFNQNLNKLIDCCQTIANTENLIYDFESGDKGIQKTII